MKTRAMRIHATGGSEQLRWETVELPPPGDGEVLIRHHAAGLNFIDIYHRSGLYPLPLPATLGVEGAGVAAAVGAGVSDIREGDRVGYCVAGTGGYSEYRIAAAARLIKLPADVGFASAAAMLLKGMTVEYLIRRAYPVSAGDVVLWHAAAGGVGLIACQWLRQLGATVIGTVGNEEKAEIARANGCAHTILSRQEDIARRVMEITDGKGVPVAYDSVGAATFEATLNSLSARGMFVSFGNASGPAPPVEPLRLAQKGSLFFTRPTLHSYCLTTEEMRASADALFFAVRAGVKATIGQRYAMIDVARAQDDLAARKTVAGTVLLPPDMAGD